MIGLLSWWLAKLSSQTITTPLEKLSQTIQQLPIGPYLPPLKTAYQDIKIPPTAGGLGLYIVTMTCEKLHWQLSWQRAPHQGTLIVVHYLTESPMHF